MTRVFLSKLSVCECGFPLLDEAIQLGTEYLITESDRIDCVLICGGCQTEHSLIAVMTFPRGQSRGGYVPEKVFEEL